MTNSAARCVPQTQPSQYKYLFFEIKKPEPSQDQAQVVTGTTQQDIQLVAFCPFQVIAPQQPIGFQMTDHRFNRLAAFE